MRLVSMLTATLLLAATPAGAQPKAAVTVTQTARTAVVTVTVSGTAKRPSTVTVAYGRRTVRLRRSGGGATRSVWRSGTLTGAARRAVTGRRAVQVRVTVRTAGRSVRLTATSRVATGKAPAPPGPPGVPAPGVPAPGTPAPGTPAPGTPAPGGPASLFGTPATALEGQAALDALTPYLTNFHFTDCPAHWPNCMVEQRYSLGADGSHWYCRLTSTSGSDIRSAGNYWITGLRQETSGAWAITYKETSGGYDHAYRWEVQPDGRAIGGWWSSFDDQVGGLPATETYTGMQWMSGAPGCSY